MKLYLRNALSMAVNRYITPHLPATATQPLISKVARFVACEMIEGDYLEFGTYQGASFIQAYRHFKMQFESRIAQREGGTNAHVARHKRQKIWDSMRFFAFDSFAGLPKRSLDDAQSEDFQEGQYSCSLEQFRAALQNAAVPLDRTHSVKGWFSETCSPTTRMELGLHKAAVVHIDSDLYSSCKTALEFVTPLLQDGTIIIFDDWFSYKGSPYAGEQRAFWEWAQAIAGNYSVQEYNKEDWKRCSFIVSHRIANKPDSGDV